MFDTPVLTRLALGATIGLLIGIVAFVLTPFLVRTHQTVEWGVLLWYPTMGAVIALVALVDWPWRRMPPGMVLGVGIGIWFDFLLMLVAERPTGEILEHVTGDADGWGGWCIMLIKGAIAGGFIGWVVSRYGSGDRGPDDI